MMPNFLISRLASSFKTLNLNNPKSQLNLLQQHKSHLIFFNSLATKDTKRPKDHNFTISYLIAECGFSPETAALLSQKVQFKTPEKPNAVLALLRQYGFSDTQIAKFIQKRPLFLLTDAEKIIKPKLMFFSSIGIPRVLLPKLVIENQNLLARSLEKCLIPRYEVLKSVVRSEQEIVCSLKRGAMAFVLCDVMKNLIPNTKVLRDLGVPQSSISLLVMFHPSEAFMNHERFAKCVKLAKEMGFDPNKCNFISAVHVLSHMDCAKMDRKMKSLEKWGWSKEVSLSSFRKFPTFMSYSPERIGRAMRFLVEDMGWSSEDIARFPTTLGYSLEKRVIPRCHVIKVLKSKRLVKDQLCLATFMCMKEEEFLEDFVTKYLDQVPLLPKVYQGLVDYKDLL
ncbi:uncharacterized protein LOC107496557 [Arachis duranensis]|uniref:Uncharacterized protein LOC107496557 n=1 Tax=Arachis duranensis TaxID=130453 RepID=A0A6P4DWH2_ARADU|nr:uncharacterized protein LOC107496557 [Arachis duranensis]